MLRKLCVAASMAAVAVATPARAQLLPSFDIEAYGGAYVPLQDLIVTQMFGAEFTQGQQKALALGGRLTWWVAGPLGLEGNIVYAFSDVEAGLPGNRQTIDANVWMADGRLAFRFGIPLAPVSFHLNGGGAYIKRGGDAFATVTDGDESFAGVVGVGLKVDLPALVGLRADVDSYLYKAEITGTDPASGTQVSFGSQFQSDIVVSLGLVFGLGL